MKVTFNILFLLLLVSSSLLAQDVEFRSTLVDSIIKQHQTFRAIYEVNRTEIDSFTPPSFNSDYEYSKLDISTTASVINETTSFNTTYKFHLIPNKSGLFKLPSMTITINNKEYKTDAINFSVLPKLKEEDNSAILGDFKDDIILRTNVSDQKMKLSDSLSLSYELLVSQDVSVESWDFKSVRFIDFVIAKKENLKLEIEEIKIGDTDYRYIKLNDLKLIPKRKGVLSTDKQIFIIALSVPTGTKNIFGLYNREKKLYRLEAESKKIEIN